MVLAPNGKRVYPSVLSSPNSASCPLTPPCPLTPSSPVPPSLSDISSCLQGTFERRKSNIDIAPVYTPFTPSLPVDPAYPYPDSTEIDMPLYDFSQDFYPTYSVQLPASHFDDDEDMPETGINDQPTSLIPTYVYGLDKSHPIAQIPKTARSATLDGALRMSISKNSKVKNRLINPNPTPTSRRREKAYRCPVITVFTMLSLYFLLTSFTFSQTPRCTKVSSFLLTFPFFRYWSSFM